MPIHPDVPPAPIPLPRSACQYGALNDPGLEKPRRRHTVVAVIGHGLSPLEFAIACEIFGVDRSDLGVPWYRFLVCSADPSPVRTIIPGMTVNAELGLEALRRADTIVVPVSGLQSHCPPELFEALRRANAREARIVSLCTGAFTLAAAGLLDGRPATTHWMHADELARRFPAVQVNPRVLYVDDGDILTAAGAAAGLDLCLHIVRSDFGAEIANEVARRVVIPPHREGGQAQYVTQPVGSGCCTDDRFTDTLDWAQAHLHEDLSVEVLARRAVMSPRTFARRFSAATGTTPHQWILGQRVMFAQRLLETSELPIDIVAERCGLGTAANLRQQFQRAVGTAPSAYRRTFRAAAG